MRTGHVTQSQMLLWNQYITDQLIKLLLLLYLCLKRDHLKCLLIGFVYLLLIILLFALKSPSTPGNIRLVDSIASCRLALVVHCTKYA